jgi:hypothetical protein
LILSILSFWPALLAVSAIFIFAITNLSHLLGLYPQYHLNTVFHLTAYSAAALIWIQYLDRRSGLERHRPLWPLWAICPPLLLLGAVLGGCVYYDKPIWWVDVATALFGIAASTLISIITAVWPVGAGGQPSIRQPVSRHDCKVPPGQSCRCNRHRRKRDNIFHRVPT